MHITVSPSRRDHAEPETAISVSGDTVTVDGTAYDLSGVPDGAEATPAGAHPFVGTITREGGAIRCTIRVAYDPATAEADQPTDPAHWQVDVTSGPVPDLIQRRA